MIEAAPASRAKERRIYAQHPVRSMWGICWSRASGWTRSRGRSSLRCLKTINSWKGSQEDEKTQGEGARGTVNKEVAGGMGSGDWWREEGTSVGLVRFRVSATAVIGLDLGGCHQGY